MPTPFGQVNVRDVLDILLVTFLVYQGYLLVAGTRAVNVVRGILVFAGVWVAAQVLNLPTLSYLLGRAGTVGIFALVVLFQPELRAALERVGRPRGRDTGASGAALQDLARAMERLAERKTGALIAIERRTPLGEYAATGVSLDALVSVPFLEALFARNAPLHDGGVIIQGSRVISAGCLFPLQSSDGTYRRYGTRHRAAIGLSELTDAVVLVVSEERGSMRIALAGRLGPDLNGTELREQLRALVYDRTAFMEPDGSALDPDELDAGSDVPARESP
ncbi:TIGR00159 family protein [Deinococcus seoulensis]|uniref:Diadenylate cyclase n=2 Tax=Deinococcus TaxID=1298 RepID=A0ABQ2RUV6_9DEIO|nr:MULTISPECIES: diadenylate cyclase CdaA [Deinococcus]GGR61715.1 TIGR00159 family protein [Deinococcus seoulensis]GGS35143.1 TIGR00159 family protein [Deinococcus knuensis]